MSDDWRKLYMLDGVSYEGMPDTEEMYVLWDAALEAIDGTCGDAGDLKPLATYIRAGGAISGLLAETLAGFIEHEAKPTDRKRGPSAKARAEKRERRLHLGAMALVRVVRSPRAHQSRIFAEVGKLQVPEVPPGQVEASFKEFCREARKEWHPLSELWRMRNDALREYCRERGLSFEAELFGIDDGENLA